MKLKFLNLIEHHVVSLRSYPKTSETLFCPARCYSRRKASFFFSLNRKLPLYLPISSVLKVTKIPFFPDVAPFLVLLQVRACCKPGCFNYRHWLVSHFQILSSFRFRLIFDGNEILISSLNEKKYFGIILFPFSMSILNYSSQPSRSQKVSFTMFSILQNGIMIFSKNKACNF